MANKHGRTQMDPAKEALLGLDHASTNGGALHSPRAATWTRTIHLYHAPSAATETPRLVMVTRLPTKRQCLEAGYLIHL